MDHVLEPPSYGWKDEQGQLVIPTTNQLVGEFFFRLNIFRNKKNWLTFFSWSRVLMLVSCLFIFAFKYFNFDLLGVAFLYSMIVMGTHGRTGFPKLTLGSVAENVFRKASCPVLTVGPNSPADWPEREMGAEKAILLATDFGDASLAALPYGASIANRSRSKLVVLYVNRPVPESPANSVFGDETVSEELRYAALQQLQKLLPGDLGIEPELRVTAGLPVDGILSEAAGNSAGLIVLGLHRRSLLVPAEHLPSTAYGVVIQARCPVLTVRT